MIQKILCAILCTMTLSLVSHAQWFELGTPGDGAFYCLGNEGDTLYAGTQYDLIRSTDNGSTWELKDIGLPTSLIPVISLATAGGIVFAGNESEGIYRSANHGESWTLFNGDLPASVKNVRVLFGYGEQIYLGIAGIDSKGFYYSNDSGNTWKIFANGPDTTVTAITASNDTLVAGTIDGRVFVSTDNGNHWNDTIVSNGVYSPIQAAAILRGKIFVTIGGYGVFRSSNTGLSWTQIINGFTDNPVWSRPLAVIDTVLFTGIDYSGNGGVWRTTNDGDSWENTSGNHMIVTTFPPYGTVDVFYKQYSMMVHGSTLFVGTFGYGLLTSTDMGNSWSHVTVPFKHIAHTALTAFGDTVLVSASDIEGMYISTNNGQHWEGYRTNLTSGVSSFIKNDSGLYAGALYNTHYGSGVFRSTDNGISWTAKSNGLQIVPTNMLIQDGEIMYAATDGGLFSSTDFANTWNSTNWTNNAVGIYAKDSIIIVGKILPQRTYRSHDYGLTWDSLGGGLPTNFAARTFATIGEQIFMCGTGSSSSLFRSTDRGTSWMNITGATSAVQVLSSGDTLWVNGISPNYSTNGGTSWTPINISGLPGSLSQIAIGNGWLYGAISSPGKQGVFRKALQGTVDVRTKENSIPASFTLNQNYPNPFNPVTTITYSIAKAGYVDLSVYDVLGRQIVILENTFKTPGLYSTTFNANNLSSGIYFYKLIAGNFSAIKKMMLLK